MSFTGVFKLIKVLCCAQQSLRLLEQKSFIGTALSCISFTKQSRAGQVAASEQANTQHSRSPLSSLEVTNCKSSVRIICEY